MIDSKVKGSRAELLARDVLRKATGLNWQRTPLSGALDPAHGLKADIYVPNEKNLYSIEIKHYKDDHLTSKVLTGKDPQLLIFMRQTIRQARETNKKPLLIFKHDRSKFFAAFEDFDPPNINHLFINVNDYAFYVVLLEEWLLEEKPKFII